MGKFHLDMQMKQNNLNQIKFAYFTSRISHNTRKAENSLIQ